MPKIDLQIHSTYSDGLESPQELITLAQKAGIALVALTDHDSTDGVEEMIQAGLSAGVKVIPGVEIMTKLQGNTLHILGYNIDIKNKTLKELLAHLCESRKTGVLKKMKEVNEILAAAGKPTVDLDVYVRDHGKHYNFSTAGDYLVKNGFADNQAQANDYLNGLKVSDPDVTPRIAIEAINQAGGVAVLSHPLGPKISLKLFSKNLEEQKKILIDLKSWGLKGMECFTTAHDDNDIKQAVTFARELDLLMTGGSDWHGQLALKGDKILGYLPFYLKNLGDLIVPEEEAEKVISFFSIKK